MLSVKLCCETFDEKRPEIVEYNNAICDKTRVRAVCDVRTKVFKRTLSIVSDT